MQKEDFTIIESISKRIDFIREDLQEVKQDLKEVRKDLAETKSKQIKCDERWGLVGKVLPVGGISAAATYLISLAFPHK